MKILAIETSCDETAIAILECSGSKKKPEISVLSNLVFSQVELHAKFGGVVPNLAKREHQKNLIPLLIAALKEAKLFKRNPTAKDLHKKELNSIFEHEPELLEIFNAKVLSINPPDVDVIAVTHGPGLAPALWVGVNFARALALLWGKPLIPVNHMEGHLYSALLGSGHAITFPALALLVSGGHTELVLMKKFGAYTIIGETLDDAAGEAFDKVARLLGLGYPGGPAISAEAEKAKDNSDIKLPRPMMHSKDYNFSFSGLKTAVLYLIRDIKNSRKIKKLRPAIAKEFQNAVIDVLISKTLRAAKEYSARTILLGGGVAANTELRRRLGEMQKKELPDAKLLLPNPAYTGDNALMIGLAAYYSGKRKARSDVRADANLRLSDF